MAKKRGKSGGSSTTEIQRWESDLLIAPYEEDNWKPFVVFVIPDKVTDLALVDSVVESVGTGLRKLYCNADLNGILEELKELGALKGGKAEKGKTPAKPPQFVEICDQVKHLKEQGRPLSSAMKAKLIKFKMLILKQKDQDRREEEKKALEAASKAKATEARGKSASRKSASPVRGKSGSPGKGGKKGKKEDSSPKKDTQMKRRGEGDDTFTTVDDEPDGLGDPSQYVVVSGVRDAAVIHHLIEMLIPVHAIIGIQSGYHRLLQAAAAQLAEEGHEETLERAPVDSLLALGEHVDEDKLLSKFWNESDMLSYASPEGSKLKDLAKFTVDVADDCLPEKVIPQVDAEKKVQFGTWLFNKVADVCYDTLDYRQQYEKYLDNLKLINVSAIPVPEPIAGEDETEVVIQTSSHQPQVAPESDLRYYKKLMSRIPLECDSVPLQLNCLLEQVVALSDGPNPMDIPPPAREDGLDDVVGSYLDKRLASLGMGPAKDNKLKPSIHIKPPPVQTPNVIYHNDEQRFRLIKMLDQSNEFDANAIEEKMRSLHPYSFFFKYLYPSEEEWVDSCVRRQQLYSFCAKLSPISVEKFERSMRQYVFESLPLETATDVAGDVTEPPIVEEQLEKILSRYDDPYYDAQKMNAESTASIKQENSTTLSAEEQQSAEKLIVSASGKLENVTEKQVHSKSSSPLFTTEDPEEEILMEAATEEGRNSAEASSEEAAPAEVAAVVLGVNEDMSLRTLEEYSCLERFEPNILLQVLDKASEIRPYIDTYYNRGNNTMLVVLHNPSNNQRQNNYAWDGWLHTNVGFRNYLEHVAVQIDDWIQEEDRLEEEGDAEALRRHIEETTVSPQPAPSIKERSRFGMLTRAELLAQKEEDKKDDKKKGRSRSGSPKKSAGSNKSPDKKKGANRTPSAKKSRTGTGKSKSKSSEINVVESIVVPSIPPKEYTFTGYNLSDNLLHISGDQSYMFPVDGSLVKIDKLSFAKQNTLVSTSVFRGGNVFSVRFVNPREIEETEELNTTTKATNPDGEPAVAADDGSRPASQATSIKLPDLPSVAAPVAAYSSLVASFADGLQLSLSASVPEPMTAVQAAISKILLSSASKETTPVISDTTAPSAPPKSPKGKRDKGKPKEEDVKSHEDLEKQMESDRHKQVNARYKEIFTINKEKEFRRSLYLSTPTGLHITFSHNLTPAHEETKSQDAQAQGTRQFFVKQEQLLSGEPEDTLEGREAITEVYRCFTMSGGVVKFLSTGTVEVLHADGSIWRSVEPVAPPKPTAATTVQLPSNAELAASVSVARRPVSKVKSGKGVRTPHDEAAIPVVISEPLDDVTRSREEWMVVSAEGEVRRVWGTGREAGEYQRTLNLSVATCQQTGEILKTREDGVITVERPNGMRIVEFRDGTRITSYLEDVPVDTRDEETGEARETGDIEIWENVKIEHESFMTVIANKQHSVLKVLFGNGKCVVGHMNGGYNVSTGDGTQLIIDKEGEALLPCQRTQLSASLARNFLEKIPDTSLLPADSCVMKHTTSDCLVMVDADGNRFEAQATGDYRVDAKPTEQSKCSIPPRYFILYADGSGEELLSSAEIDEYVETLRDDDSAAVIRTPVGDDPDATAVTVMKPHLASVWEHWKIKKDEKQIIPAGLIERDFKTFPAQEVKKHGPKFGTNVGVAFNVATKPPPKPPQRAPPSMPSVLEIRHLMSFTELGDDTRERIVKGINAYGDFVAKQQEIKSGLKPKETQTAEEKIEAENLRKKYYELQNATKRPDEPTDESAARTDRELANTYTSAIAPPPSPPPVHAHPERAAVEWEKDKIELAELKYARDMIHSRRFPPYFDTEEGQQFLYNNDMLPDMQRYTEELAAQTLHPTVQTPSIASTFAVERSEVVESTSTEADSPKDDLVPSKTPHNDMSPTLAQGAESSMSLIVDDGISPFPSSEVQDTRPYNPTPAAAKCSSVTEGLVVVSDNNLETIFETSAGAPSVEAPSVEPDPVSVELEPVMIYPVEYHGGMPTKDNTGAMSMHTDVRGDPRQNLVRPPPSILGSRPNAIPNTQFSNVEEDVRRKVKTASVAGAVNTGLTNKMRGFILIPDQVDFGTLKEGLSYLHPVMMKNVGVDQCRYKIKQPPPSTGLKAIYKPGPVAAGMSAQIQIELFAVAVGVEGSCGVGQVAHHLEVITETDVIYLPIVATILTQTEYDESSCAGPTKDVIVCGARPNSREALTRPRKK